LPADSPTNSDPTGPGLTATDAGPHDRLVDNRNDPLDVGTRRHLRHDTPPPRMEGVLAGHHARYDRAVTRDDRGGGLVAGGFDRKQGHGDEFYRR
jgi:hypothetical protein